MISFDSQHHLYLREDLIIDRIESHILKMYIGENIDSIVLSSRAIQQWIFRLQKLHSSSSLNDLNQQQTSRLANRTRFNDDLEILSQKLKLNSQVFAVWFQNARQKARKSYGNNQNDSTIPNQQVQQQQNDDDNLIKHEKDEAQQQQQQTYPSTFNPSSKKDNYSEQCDKTFTPSNEFNEHQTLHMQALLNAAAFCPLAAYHPATMAALSSQLFPNPPTPTLLSVPTPPQSTSVRLNSINDLTKVSVSSSIASEDDSSNEMEKEEDVGTSTDSNDENRKISNGNNDKKYGNDQQLINEWNDSSSQSNDSTEHFQFQFHKQQQQKVLSNGHLSPTGSIQSSSNGINGQRRFCTQMSPLQMKLMKAIFMEYRTPTMPECKLLGKEIDLQKRVVQVWFQNPRAKEKKNQNIFKSDHQDEYQPTNEQYNSSTSVLDKSTKDEQNQSMSYLNLMYLMPLGMDSYNYGLMDPNMHGTPMFMLQLSSKTLNKIVSLTKSDAHLTRAQYTQAGKALQQSIDNDHENVDTQTIDVGYSCKRCNLFYLNNLEGYIFKIEQLAYRCLLCKTYRRRYSFKQTKTTTTTFK
ncbi:hypothetical protein I4U23_017748 [Adineta vaga]|nr:hypothetical protein I4U23_017748 [Adineta vaga]